MRQSDSDWASDLFAAGVRDFTPASARGLACVLYAPIASDPEAARRCASILSESELQRAQGFLSEDARANFMQRRAFRRYCGAVALATDRPLSRIAFAETENGRPYLPDAPRLWFSFSACRRGFLGAWSATRAVGVDVEDETQSLEAVELAQRYFSPAEAEAVETAGPARLQTFLRLWGLKEAALKSIGEGLPFGLDAFTFELEPKLRVIRAPRNYGGPQHFDPHLREDGDCCAAIVVRETSK